MMEDIAISVAMIGSIAQTRKAKAYIKMLKELLCYIRKNDSAEEFLIFVIFDGHPYLGPCQIHQDLVDCNA